DGARHVHAHAHDAIAHDAHAHHGHPAHGSDPHQHDHTHGLLPRALAVGGLHGLAGSGALVLLSMQMLGSTARSLAYILCFSLGSILGMVAFSLALSLPFSLSPRLLDLATGRLEAVLGVVT